MFAKFSWPLAAITATLVSGVIAANVFIEGKLGPTVMSVFLVILAVLYVDKTTLMAVVKVVVEEMRMNSNNQISIIPPPLEENRPNISLIPPMPLLAFFGVLYIGIGLGLGVCACGGQLTAGDRAELADHASKLAHCQAVGKDAGSYSAYENCKKEGGIE